MFEMNKILPFATEPVKRAATPLIQGAREMSADFQLERSLKLVSQGVHWNRFLLGTEARSINADELRAYARRIGMPSILLTSIEDHYADASTLLIGFEQQDSRIIYKLYLEFWDQVVQKMRNTRSNEPLLLNLGFKWDREDKMVSTVTHYYYHPLLTVNHILVKIRAIFEAKESTLREVIEAIVLQAARKVAHPSFTYMEATEPNQRHSFDLNIYQADLSLSDIQSNLVTITGLMGTQQTSLHDHFKRYGTCTLGHISGGYDRQGAPFITIYYED